MSFSLVQSAHVTNNNTINFPSNVAAGNVVVIGIDRLTSNNEPIVTDGNGFVLETLGFIARPGGNQVIFIAVALNSSGGTASYLVRWPTGGNASDVWAYEFAPSGAGVPVYDASGTASSSAVGVDAVVTLSLTSVSELAYAIIAGANKPSAASSPWTLGLVGSAGADEYDFNASGSLSTAWTPQQGVNIASAVGIKQISSLGLVRYVNSNLATRSANPVSPLSVVSTFNVSPGTDCAFAYLVWDAASGTPAVTAVTLGGKSMTACGAAAHDTVANVFSQIWFLTSPTIAQSQQLVITFTGTMQEIYSNVACFRGVNQTTPVRPGTYQATNGSFTGSFSVTISSNATDITITCGNMGGTLGTNQALNGITEAGINEMFHDRGIVQGSSVTHTWFSDLGSGASGTFVLSGFSIQAAPPPAPTNVSHSIDASVTTSLPHEGVILNIQVDKTIVRTLREG